jgi:ABC-type transport system involved in multi-copper enzyme maturation permease subunit
MIRVVRSELLRLRRRSVLFGWFGLVVMFAVLINFVMFNVVDETGAPPADGPGVSFPSAAALLAPEGIVAGLGAAASFFGVVTLAFWALASASDYSTGLVRIIVAAEPRRWRLLLGKWIALAIVTAATCLAALAVNVAVSPVAAQAGGFSPDVWGTDMPAVALEAVGQLYLSLLVWGSIGLALATLTRSAGVAIGVGVGYVLLVEAVISAVASDIGDWLPGSILTALAQGGNDAVSLTAASASGGLYVAAAMSAAWFTFQRRDITD